MLTVISTLTKAMCQCVQNMKELCNLTDEFLTKNNKNYIFLSDFYSSIFEHYCQISKDQHLNINITDNGVVRDIDLWKSCFPTFQFNGPTLYSGMWSIRTALRDIKRIHKNKFKDYSFVEIY